MMLKAEKNVCNPTCREPRAKQNSLIHFYKSLVLNMGLLHQNKYKAVNLCCLLLNKCCLLYNNYYFYDEILMYSFLRIHII